MSAPDPPAIIHPARSRSGSSPTFGRALLPLILALALMVGVWLGRNSAPWPE